MNIYICKLLVQVVQMARIRREKKSADLILWINKLIRIFANNRGSTGKFRRKRWNWTLWALGWQQRGIPLHTVAMLLIPAEGSIPLCASVALLTLSPSGKGLHTATMSTPFHASMVKSFRAHHGTWPRKHARYSLDAMVHA